MSDSDKPEPTSTPTPPESQVQPSASEQPAPAERTPTSPGRQDRPGGGDRGERFLRGGRPQGATPRHEPVPSVQEEHLFGRAPSLRDLDREIEDELQQALAGVDEKLLSGGEVKPAGKGEQQAGPPGRKKGKVISVRGPDVFVDVGGRSQGFLPMTQFPEGPPAPGTEVEVAIEGYDHANGLLILTRKGAAIEADWSTVEEGQIVEARVIETNKGGLAVDVNGIRGFMPISQISLYRVENTEQFVNQRLKCLVTEVNREERNLVVSARALLEKEREENREKLWAELAEGQIRTGIVRSVRDFGAFVDLGGADGLLHVSEMSWQRVQDPTTLVQPGQSVQVVVLRIDREKRKLSLGMKQLTASPWDNAEETYHPGTVVPGKVTRTMDFGAFVELEPGVEGLIHISELAPQRVWRVTDVVKPGQEVQVAVLSVDKASRRISLSLKAAQPKEPEQTEEETEEAVEEAPPKPPRPRITPLRGGLGSQ
ncbi:MAG: S1 RNA-binding domain-containing protein [Gemmataceae bacterium]|nr:S1 RNA-binding domain-containing protein [Gemmataceae bacterium]